MQGLAICVPVNLRLKTLPRMQVHHTPALLLSCTTTGNGGLVMLISQQLAQEISSASLWVRADSPTCVPQDAEASAAAAAAAPAEQPGRGSASRATCARKRPWHCRRDAACLSPARQGAAQPVQQPAAPAEQQRPRAEPQSIQWQAAAHESEAGAPALTCAAAQQWQYS